MSYRSKNAITDPGEINITVLMTMLEMLVLCVQVYILHITKQPFKSLEHTYAVVLYTHIMLYVDIHSLYFKDTYICIS